MSYLGNKKVKIKIPKKHKLKELARQEARNYRPRLISRDGEKCAHCGTSEELSVDHVVPLCRGGSSRIDNLQLLCKKCNVQKGDK